MGAHNAFYDHYIDLLSALHADVLVQCKTFPSTSDFNYVSSRIRSEGHAFVYGILPLLGRAIDAGLASGQFHCPAQFATLKGTCLPRLYHRGLADLFDKSTGKLLTNSSPVVIQALRQLTLLDSKAIRPYSREVLTAFEAQFRAQQRDLRRRVINTDDQVLRLAKQFIGQCFRRFEISSFDLGPCHGPGATAERFDIIGKWKFSSWPKKAERWFPYILYGCLNPSEHLRVNGTGIPLTRKSVTRACFVPKDFRGPRLISVEPAAMQYLQQSMLSWFEKVIPRSLLRHIVVLTDQTVNQRAAERAFADNLATVDLSSASDTLSATLVWYLFSEVPHLRRLLFSLRSDFVDLPVNGPERLVAFAPMGSAICFPIESIVFAAISVATTSIVEGIGLKRASTLVRVYGDDIILPVASVDRLLTTLTSVGCSPNMNKTCYRTPFRESCGKEYYNSVDVTIVRNRLYDYCDHSINMHPVLRSLQREFFLKGYAATARYLAQLVDKIYPYAMVTPGLVVDQEPYVFGNSVEIRSEQRWNAALHYQECRVPVFKQRTQAWSSHESSSGLRAALISNSYLERFAIRYRKNTKIAWRVTGRVERHNR